MSREKECPVGRELDALVARRVMGLKVLKDQITRGAFEAPSPDDPFEYFIGSTSDRVPRYSTDIAAAWLVVENLVARRIYFEVLPPREAGDGWCVSGYSGYDASRYSKCDGSGPTFQEAICRAALEVS